MATGARDDSIWRTEDGRQLAEYAASHDTVWRLHFSNTEDRLLVQYVDGNSVVLPVYEALDDLVSHACRQLPRQLTDADRERLFVGVTVPICR